MPIITGTAALITVGKLILKQIAKEGLKKAAKAAVKQGVKKVAKSVTKKSVKQFAKRKAKDFAKRKAKDFLKGKKKGKEAIEEVQQGRGGELARRDSDVAVKFVGGKPAKGGTATLAPGGGKTSFGEINKQIDNIVGLTASIDAIVKSQYQGKKDEIEELRQDREDRRKRMRESLLESKKAVKTSGSGTEGGKKGKGFNPLKFLAMVLIGTVVLGLVNAISTLKKIMDTLGLNLHQVWLIIRYVPQALGKAFGNALKFIKTKGGKFIKAIKNKFGKGFKGAKDKIAKGFQKIAKGIKGFAQGVWKRIVNIADDLLKAGPRLMAKMGQAFKSVRGFVGGGIRRATAGVRRFIGRGGRKFLKSTASNINKVKNIAIKGFRSIKNIAIKGFNTLKGVAAKGVTRLKALATSLKQSLKNAVGGLFKGAGKTGSQILKGGVGRSASRMLIKIFGPNTAKAIVRSPLIKMMGKAAKGIKIPVIGPLIVGVTSLLSGDNIEKTLFKSLGTAIGGMIGLGLGPLGAIAGELIGETIGELIYVAFRDPEGGMDAAGELLKQKWQNALKTGTKIKDWILGGFSRFFKNFMEEHSFKLNGFVSGAIKRFTGLEIERIPNVLQLYNPFVMFPLLKDSFFPPGGEKSEEGNGAKLGSSGVGDKSKGVDQSASYEDGAEEEIVVPFPGGQQESSEPAIVSRGGMMRLGSNTRSALDTMQKEKHLAALY